MPASLLLWVPMELVKNNPRKQITGFTHHSHPLSAGLCRISFRLDEWDIAEVRSDGMVVLTIIGQV